MIIDSALLISFLSIYIYKLFLNPFSVYSVFIFLFGYSYISISDDQNKSYSFLTELVVFTSILFFFVGCFLGQFRPFILKGFCLNNHAKKLLLRVLLILGIIIFLLEMLYLGYLPIINLGNDLNVYEDSNHSLMPFGHYIVLFMAFMPSISYTYYKLNLSSKINFILISFISLFIIFNFLSRQSLFNLILSSFLAYGYFNVLKNKQIIYFLFSCIFLFYFIGNLRMSEWDHDFVLDYLKAYSNIDKDVNIYETYLTLYSSKNFTTLDNLINSTTKNFHYTLGSFSFRPLISISFLDRFGLIVYDPEYDGFKKLGTYVFESYSDFNIIGVVVFNFIFGFLSMNAFLMYKNKKNPGAIVFYSIIIYCIIMSSFTNFYFSFFIWISLIFNYFLLNLKPKIN